MNACCEDMRAFIETALMNRSDGGQVMLFRARDPEMVCKVEGLLADIVSELIGGGVGFESIVKGYMARFFDTLAISYLREVRTALGSEHKLVLFHEISTFIREHLDTVSNKQLEQRYHYSRNYYNRLFREIAGCSYSEYIRRVRLEHAEELLRNTKLSVCSISQLVGYENRGYFYHIFREKYGITPAEYRTLDNSIVGQ
jgi:YesN/AraC family two-component response regulator